MKYFIGLSLAAIIYTLMFILAGVLIPFSQGFRELGASENPLTLLFMLLNSAWVCFTIYFLMDHSCFSAKKQFISILGVMFFVLAFMTQIETLLFIDAFPILTRLDVVFLMLSMGLLPIFAVTTFLARYFKKEQLAAAVAEKMAVNIKSIFVRLGLIGVIYLCVYMVFGYFVAWQFEDLRLFYSGSTEKLGFLQQVFSNSPGMMLFQVLRGILFGAFLIPLRLMITKSKTIFLISVCLVYLCTALMLIVPNVLFPDMVRIAHLIEMTSSMFLFGIIAGNIMWGGIIQRSYH